MAVSLDYAIINVNKLINVHERHEILEPSFVECLQELVNAAEKYKVIKQSLE